MYRKHFLLNTWLFALIFSVCCPCYGAEQAPPDTNEPKLVAGERAPSLQVDQWLRGEPVERYVEGKFYVVEFWATWCGPCIQAMPHLDELANHYAEDGLEVIALTTVDPANTLDRVKEFIDKEGKEFSFRYAFCSDEATSDAYMKAAGIESIPCSFVIDRKGVVAYMGPPSNLDYVLSRVANNTWRGKEDLDALEALEKSIGELGTLAMSDPEKGLTIVKAVEAQNPARAKSLDFAYAKSLVHCRLGNFDAAKASIETIRPELAKSKNWGGLAMLAGSLASPGLNPQGVHRDFAQDLMKEIRQLAGDDWQALFQLGISYQLAGDVDAAVDCIETAIEHCPNAGMKEMLRNALTRLTKNAQEQNEEEQREKRDEATAPLSDLSVDLPEGDQKSPAAKFRISLSPADAKPGDEVQLTVNATIAGGWKVNSVATGENIFGFPTKIKITSDNLAPVEDTFQASHEAKKTSVAEQTQLYHTGELSWSRKYRVGAKGLGTTTGYIHFQVCNDERCLPPNKLSFTLTAAASQLATTEASDAIKPAKLFEPIGEPIQVSLTETDLERPTAKLSLFGALFGKRTEPLAWKGTFSHEEQQYDIYLPKTSKLTLTNRGSGNDRIQNSSSFLSIDHDKNGEISDWETIGGNRAIRVADAMYQVTSIDLSKPSLTIQQVDVPISGTIVGYKVPSFKYTSVDGKTITDKSILGRTTFLDIWAVT